MGVLKREHLSAAGLRISPQLKQHVMAEAEMLEMTANRINLLPAEDREDIWVLVEYLEEASARLRLLVEDL